MIFASDSNRVRRLLALGPLAIALSLGVASSAHAAGIEDTVGGTVGLGRAASYARVNDFMATWQNPANLAVVPDADLGFEARLPILSACYQRFFDANVEYKQPGVYEGFTGTEMTGKMCNESGLSLTANTGWAQSFDSGWGYGIGLFTPAGVGSAKYGNDTISTFYPDVNEQFQITEGGAAAPTRQMAIERDAITAYLMAGLGAAPIKQLRFGVSAGLGVASVYNKSVVSVLGGTFRDQEIVNQIRATDWAIPRVNASVVVSPFDFLELFAVATYQGDIDAKGNAVLTANGIKGAPLKNCSDPKPGSRCRIDDIRLQVPFHTMEATFGARFSVLRDGRVRERKLDPMKDELFDFEIDISWAQTSKVDQYTVTLHDKDTSHPKVPKIQFANSPDAGVSYVRNSTAVPKHWDDTWTFRAGGDVHLIPERFSIRAGVSYATRAVPVKYMNIDYWPVKKLGLHVGASLAFAERFKVHVAYARLIYQTTDVAVTTGGVKDIASLNESESDAVNEGRYTAGLDVFSLQLNATF